MNHRQKSVFAGLTCLALGFAAPAHAQLASNAKDNSSPAEVAFWQSVSETRDPAQYEAYLSAFPQGLFAGLARAKIAGLSGSSAQPASADVPKIATPAVSAPAAQLIPAVLTVAAGSSVSGLDSSFVEQLRALALSQGDRYRNVSIVIPPRPAMSAVGQLDVPAQFCSANERNAFHEDRFRPAIERASKNNTDAIAHMTMLARLAGEAQAKGDGNTSGALANESKNYEPVAQSIYLERTALASAFSRIMAVPVVPCAGATR